MKRPSYPASTATTFNYIRLISYIIAATVLIVIPLCSHVVDVHLPTSEDIRLEAEMEESHRQKDALEVETGDGRTVEFRDDGSMNCYDSDGNKIGKVS